MFLITFLLSIAFVDGQTNERIYPSNTAVIDGKQFYLICENYSDRITTTWKILRVGAFSDRVIYNGTHLLDEFRDFEVHSKANGLASLTKPIARMDDAGTYKCIQSNGTYYDVSSAQVTVLATDPVCSPKETNVLERKFLEINCSVHYAGSISPIMKWTMGDGIDSNFDANIANVSNSSSLISTLKIYATRRYNNAIFQCTTYFNQPIISNEDQGDVRKAINAPTYEHQCTSRINLLFEPQDVDITPKRDVYTIGDVLLCKANGNPTPTYEWTELGSNRVVSRESYLTVDRTAMGNHAYKCTATNNANGKEATISTTITILAIIHSPIGNSDVRSILIAAGTVFAVLCIVAAFIVCIKCLKARFHRGTTPHQDIITEQGVTAEQGVTTELQNSDQHLSTYESIDDMGGQVHIESVGLQRQEKSTGFSSTAQRPVLNETPPSDQHMTPLQDRTSYAPLGDRTTPPPTVYDRLNPQEAAIQEASSHPSEYTSHKTSSIARDVGIYQDPDRGPYVNVNLVRKVREYQQ